MATRYDSEHLKLVEGGMTALSVAGNIQHLRMDLARGHLSPGVAREGEAILQALSGLRHAHRAELAPRGVSVVGVYPGPVDTRMTAGQEFPKATPEQVAAALLAGVENGDEEIYPDSMSAKVHVRLYLRHSDR